MEKNSLDPKKIIFDPLNVSLFDHSLLILNANVIFKNMFLRAHKKWFIHLWI